MLIARSCSISSVVVVVQLWLWNEVAVPASGLDPSGPDLRSFCYRRSVSCRTAANLTLAQALASGLVAVESEKWLFHFKLDYFTLKLISSLSRLREAHSETARRTRNRHNQSELLRCGSTRSRSQANRDRDVGTAGRVVDDDVARSTRRAGSAGTVGAVGAVRTPDENLDPGGGEGTPPLACTVPVIWVALSQLATQIGRGHIAIALLCRHRVTNREFLGRHLVDIVGRTLDASFTLAVGVAKVTASSRPMLGLVESLTRTSQVPPNGQVPLALSE